MSYGGRASKEPIARGVIVPLASTGEVKALAQECISILRALDTAADVAPSAPADADFVVLLLADGADQGAHVALPDLKDRAATAIGVSDDAPTCRAAISAVRKRLRAAGATLGPHELVLGTKDFGYLGLESDGLREKLEILLGTLVADAERLRLRREGWEEPIE